SSQPDRADGEGTARSRVRRQRAFSERRSARDNKSRSIARRIAAKPLSVSSRSRSSTQSPPARFRKITASTIWISSQPCAPATRTCWRIAVPSPLAWIRSRYSGRPASEVRPPLEVSASYWKPRTPCASIPHPVGDGFGFANGAYLPDSSGPTEPHPPPPPPLLPFLWVFWLLTSLSFLVGWGGRGVLCFFLGDILV